MKIIVIETTGHFVIGEQYDFTDKEGQAAIMAGWAAPVVSIQFEKKYEKAIPSLKYETRNGL